MAENRSVEGLNIPVVHGRDPGSGRAPAKAGSWQVGKRLQLNELGHAEDVLSI